MGLNQNGKMQIFKIRLSDARREWAYQPDYDYGACNLATELSDLEKLEI